jgi:uncharacterized protein YbjT (DUF2867 family)
MHANTHENNLTVLVAGGSGFIGSQLVRRLSSIPRFEVKCITRDVESARGLFNDTVKIIKADATNYDDLVNAMVGVDIAFYLIHSMEGVTKDWRKFAERDRIAAENFANAATECRVKRIIYLGGLSYGKDEELSEHMRSRNEVGEILKTSAAKVTIFRAAIILGGGGGSFEMLRYLVERLPVMICPKWVMTKSQPIAIDDVVTYLIKSIDVKETEGKSFDIGGPNVLTYVDMMKIYGKMISKSIKIIIIPFLTPRLSSYWVDLVTPVKASLARPLIDSLKHEATAKDDSIKNLIPVKLRTFEETIKSIVGEQRQETKLSETEHVLSFLLLVMAAIGLTYYLFDERSEIFQLHWLVLNALWYLGIIFSIFFIRGGARLGALSAGVLGWITLALWLIDNLYVVSGNSLLTSGPNLVMMVRNFIGALVASLVVVISHYGFHKIPKYRKKSSRG